ncbi:MAG: lipase maturation factor family protein [Elusimicrobia bacterium]|nr:lipase maturation factor family protein [Elusimicrobiota bacterium]
MTRRPVLVFDGDCGFCRLWIERWRRETGDAVDYEPYQSAAARHADVPREAFREAIHLFEADKTSRGAEAALRALSYAPRLGWLARLYAAPGAAALSEAVYRFVAARRPLFARLTRLLWGASTVPAPVGLTARLVVAGLGACYLIAFVSLGTQVRGLIGSDGIMPAAAMLDSARGQLGAARFWLLPSVAWLSASDAALSAYCWLGAAASLGMVLGLAAGPCALLCWTLYLSLCAIGSDFMSFQWDVLLLEAGLIACFLAPWSWTSRKASAPSRGALWLLRLLLLKLMLQSGLVKLFSGDPSWRDLTALTYHYWTQPLPTPPAWWFNLLPSWAHKASCLVLFAIELAAPSLILLPRRARAAGGIAIAILMLLIALTGNYGIFIALTVVLCQSCLDDRFFGRVEKAPAKFAPPKARARGVAAVAALSLSIGAFGTLAILGVDPPAPARALAAAVSPLRSFNRYGLFSVMTRSRDEIAVEVSADGREWLEWPFPYKPGDPRRAPPVVAPHMPRLDWQCWFAALGEPGDSPWFANLMFRLLEGSPSVTGLMGPAPLAGGLPLYARAVRYKTEFASPEVRRAGGAWWTRERKGLFFPVVSLKR